MGLYSDQVVLFDSSTANYNAAGTQLSGVTTVTTATGTYYGPAVSFANFSGGVLYTLPGTVTSAIDIAVSFQAYFDGKWVAVSGVTGSLTDAAYTAAGQTTSTLTVKSFGGNAPAYAGNLLRAVVVATTSSGVLTAITGPPAYSALNITADARKLYPDNA